MRWPITPPGVPESCCLIINGRGRKSPGWKAWDVGCSEVYLWDLGQNWQVLRFMISDEHLCSWVGFSRQEHCSGLPFPSPEDLSDLGIEPMSLMSPALAGWFFTTSALGKPSQQSTVIQNCLPKEAWSFTSRYLFIVGSILSNFWNTNT